MVFLELLREPGVCSRVTAGEAIKKFSFSVKSGLLSSYDGHPRNLNYAWLENMDPSEGEPGDRGSLSPLTVILIFLSIFKKSQASSPFESVNSVCLSR